MGGRSEGWQSWRRTKTEGDVADNKENMLIRLERHRSLPTLQPFCPIITKCTREVAGFNSLADVLKRLDFRSAVHDIRRFQYVSTILKLLLTPEKLYQLAGASQKLIFRFSFDHITHLPIYIPLNTQGKHFSPITLPSNLTTRKTSKSPQTRFSLSPHTSFSFV